MLGTKKFVLLQQNVELVTLTLKVNKTGSVVTVDGITYLPNNNQVSVPNVKIGTEVTVKAKKKGCKDFNKSFSVQKDTLEQNITLECNVTPKARYGRVTIQARPFAYVYYRGRNIGTTPIRNRRMRAGSHQFELRNQSGARKTITLRVRTGATARSGVVDMR